MLETVFFNKVHYLVWNKMMIKLLNDLIYILFKYLYKSIILINKELQNM